MRRAHPAAGPAEDALRALANDHDRYARHSEQWALVCDHLEARARSDQEASSHAARAAYHRESAELHRDYERRLRPSSGS